MAGQGPQYTSSSSWTPIVQAIYPDILSATHSVPPMHFHRVPYRRAIVPGTDNVPGVGPVPGTGLPALVLQQPLAAGHPAPTHDLTPDCLPPMTSAPSQQPVSSSSQQPISSSQKPISSSQKPMSSSQKPMSSPSQQPMSSSQKPVSSPSQHPMSSPSQHPMSSPSQPPMSSSQQPMSSQSQKLVSSPSQQLMLSSQKPVSSPSQQPMSSPSQHPMSSSQQPMSSQSQQPMSSPIQLPMSSSQQPVSSPSQQPTSSPSQKPMSSQSQQPMSSPSQQPMSSPSQQPVSSPSQQPMSSPSKKPMSSQSQQPMSSQSQQPMSSPSQKPMSSQSQQPMSSPSQQPMSSPNQQSMSSQSQQPKSTPRSFLNMEPLRNIWSSYRQQRSKQKGRKYKKQKPILPPVLQTDVNDDEAQAQVLRNLQELAQHRNEVMFIISQLNFTDYLNKPEYAAAVAFLPTVPMNPKTGRKVEGDFDILIINRQYGILIGELKTVGSDPASRTDAIVDNTVRKALAQLDKSEALMKHLVSDVASPPGLTVRTSLFLPFVDRTQLQRVFASDPQLEQDACHTLGARDAVQAAELCLCSDQLSKPSEWWDVTPDVITELDNWWQGRMDHADPEMSDSRYIELVARFVGPATSVMVNCSTRPRLEVKTVDKAIHELDQQLSTLVLTEDQVNIMQHHSTMPLVFLVGPPGTGKTVVLTLVGLCRLRQGKDVHVVSGHVCSMAASIQLKNQLKTTLRSYSTSTSGCGKVYLHHYELKKEAEKDRAVRELTAIGPDVFLIFDEMVKTGLGEPPTYFQDLLTELRARITYLRLWAAGIVHKFVPPELLQIPLTTPLRSAPSILREVQKEIANYVPGCVYPYINTMYPAAGDGMRVERLVHDSGDLNGHTGLLPEHCFLCGQNVAAVLRRLGVGVPGSNIDLRDVFILTWNLTPFETRSRTKNYLRKHVTGDASTTTNRCNLVHGVRHDGLAVRVMADNKNDWATCKRELGKVAEATRNSIIVANYSSVQGMERKVVVVLGDVSFFMVYAASRATTQLVVVSTN